MPKELNIEIGEPIPNSFDYSLAPSELDKQLSEKMAQVRRGEMEATHEFTMLGYALDFIDFVKSNVDIELTFDEDELPHYCEILGEIQKSFAQDPPPDDFLTNVIKAATGFFGVMVIKNLGGNWAQSNAGMAVIHNGTSAFVMNRIGRFLQNGEDDMGALYEHLKSLS